MEIMMQSKVTWVRKKCVQGKINRRHIIRGMLKAVTFIVDKNADVLPSAKYHDCFPSQGG